MVRRSAYLTSGRIPPITNVLGLVWAISSLFGATLIVEVTANRRELLLRRSRRRSVSTLVSIGFALSLGLTLGRSSMDLRLRIVIRRISIALLPFALTFARRLVLQLQDIACGDQGSGDRWRAHSPQNLNLGL